MSSKTRQKKAAGASSIHSKVAQRIVSESLKLKPGESVTIETWNGGLDFAKELVRAVRKAGALPLLILEDDDSYLWGLGNVPKDSLGKMGKHEYGLLSSTDAYIFIPGPLIGTYTPSVPRDLGSAGTAYNSSWYESAEKAGVRGVRLTFGYVGPDLARILGKKADDVVLRQLKASLVSLEEIRSKGDLIMQRLSDGAEAKIESGKSSLSFRLKGDLGIEDGVADEADVAAKNNISYILPGLIWKEIDPETASGSVSISSAVTRLGLIDGATLEFEGGRLTSWKGSTKLNQKKLNELVSELSEDKRKLSLMFVGLNSLLPYGYGQDRFVSGAITLGGFGFTGVVKNGTLVVGSEHLIGKGKIETLEPLPSSTA